MVRRLAALLTGIWLLAAPLSAQRVEVSFSGGYTASEGVTVDERVVPARSTTGRRHERRLLPLHLRRLRQPKRPGRVPLRPADVHAAGQRTGLTRIADMNVSNYHGNFVYNWGESDAKVRPFAFVGLGATNYSSGDYTALGGKRTISPIRSSRRRGAVA